MARARKARGERSISVKDKGFDREVATQDAQRGLGSAYGVLTRFWFLLRCTQACFQPNDEKKSAESSARRERRACMNFGQRRFSGEG